MRKICFFIVCIFTFIFFSCSKSTGDEPKPPLEVPELPETDTILGEIIVDNNNTIRKYTYYYDDNKRIIRWNDSIKYPEQPSPTWEWVNSHIFSYNNAGLISEMKIIGPTSRVTIYSMTYSNDFSLLIWKPDSASSLISHHFKLNSRLQILSDTPYINGFLTAEYTNYIYDSITGNLKERHRLQYSKDTMNSIYYTYDNKKNPYKSLNQADLYFEDGMIGQNNLLEAILKTKNGTGVFRKWTYTYNNLDFAKQATLSPSKHTFYFKK
jgi:hypothetical protein